MQVAAGKKRVSRDVVDRVVLIVVVSVFAFSAFAMNPKGMDWFDILAVSTLAMLGVWTFVRRLM